MTRRTSLWLVAGAVVIATARLAAHHSVAAEFDPNKPITFTGTVAKVEWMNPHVYTHIESKDADGKTRSRAATRTPCSARAGDATR